MESLYSNKFSKITNLYNVTYKPTSPFKWITKQIVSARKYDPGQSGEWDFKELNDRTFNLWRQMLLNS